MPTLHSRSPLPDAPYARFSRLLETVVIRHIAASRMHLAGARVLPGDVTFVHIEVGLGVTFGITALAGLIRRDGSQILTACSEEDRSIAAVAARILEILEIDRPHVPRRWPAGPVSTPSTVVSPEVSHVQ